MISISAGDDNSGMIVVVVVVVVVFFFGVSVQVIIIIVDVVVGWGIVVEVEGWNMGGNAGVVGTVGNGNIDELEVAFVI